MLTTEIKGYSDDVEAGKAEAALPDGTTVTAEDESLPDGLLLVVEGIETGDADYDRIAAYMEGLGTNPRVYDIYFVDSNGQRYEASEMVTVTISLNGAYQSPAIYYVSPENGASKADSSVKNDRISFRASPDKSVYYVLAEQKSSSDDPGQGGGTGGTGGSGDDGDTPDGGSGSGGENSRGTGSAGNTGGAGSTAGTGDAGSADSSADAGNADSTAGAGSIGAAENAGSTGNPSGAGNAGSNTGDGTSLTLWLFSCTGATAVLAAVLVAGKRREKREHKE